jgi:hypothetical protein
MPELNTCPLCKEGFVSVLWAIPAIPDEQQVALKLMEIDKLCPDCWEKHMAELPPEEMLGVLVDVMTDYTSLKDDYEQLEESTEKELEGLTEENKNLTEALEDMKGRIADVLR